MLNIRLTPAAEERLNRLAKDTGRTKVEIARDAIHEHLADLEDFYLANARALKHRKGIPLASVEQRLGLAGSAERHHAG